MIQVGILFEQYKYSRLAQYSFKNLCGMSFNRFSVWGGLALKVDIVFPLGVGAENGLSSLKLIETLLVPRLPQRRPPANANSGRVEGRWPRPPGHR